jgi:AcrR family transcriptional regulator
MTEHTPRKRLSAAERRETILRAATEVFAQAGYRATKMSDVAARVGVTEPVIFQQFGSKAALFAAVLERAAAGVEDTLKDLTAGSGSGSALLTHVVTGFAHGRTDQGRPDPGRPDPGRTEPGASGQAAGPRGAGHAGDAYGVLFADVTALADEPELTEPARRAFRTVAAHLADVIRHAQADGGVRADVDPEAAAWLLLSVLSASRLRLAAMPAGLQPSVAALTLRALTG